MSIKRYTVFWANRSEQNNREVEKDSFFADQKSLDTVLQDIAARGGTPLLISGLSAELEGPEKILYRLPKERWLDTSKDVLLTR